MALFSCRVPLTQSAHGAVTAAAAAAVAAAVLPLQLYGYSYDFRWWALLMVSSYVIGFTVLGVVFLKYVSFLKR